MACQRQLILLLSLSLLVIQLSQAQEPIYEITGRGATFPQPIYDEWFFAFRLSRPEVKFHYEGLGSSAGLNSMQTANPEIDYGASDAPLPEANYSIHEDLDLQMFPLVAGAVVVNYNIDGISSRDPQLVLDRSVVADMFSGRITRWNDPRILADNPSLASKLPNGTIELVVRKDGSGTTSIFSSAMSSFSRFWNSTYGTFTSWPSSLLNMSNIHTAPGNGGVYATTLAIPNSVGYVSYPYIYNQDFGLYAKMKNQAGSVVSANIQYLSAAMDNVQLNSRFNGVLNDLPGSDAFPMAGFSCKYTCIALVSDMEVDILIQKNFNQRCDERRELMKWFRWVLTNKSAKERASEVGYAPLTDKIAQQVLGLLNTLTCDGELLLRVDRVPQHQGAAFPAILAVAMFFLVTVVVCSIILMRDPKYTNISIMYICLLVIGACLSYLAVVFWFLVPEQTWVCELRKWLTVLGFTLLLVGVFSRTYSIIRVFTHLKTSEKLTPNYFLNFFEVFGVVALILGVQLVILVLWTALDPWQATEILVDDLNLQTEWFCNSSNIHVWLGLEAGFFGFLLIWGLWVVYICWFVKESIRESRWLLISVYNLILVLVVLIIVLLLIEMNDDRLYFVAAVSITFSSSNLALAVFVPVVLKKTIDSIKSHSSGSSHRERRSKISKTTKTASRESKGVEDIEMNEDTSTEASESVAAESNSAPPSPEIDGTPKEVKFLRESQNNVDETSEREDNETA